MQSMRIDIDDYRVHICSHPEFNTWIALITLRKGNRTVANLRFVEDPENSPFPPQINLNGVSSVYVSMSYFSHFLSILRNEKPLSIQLVAADATRPDRILLSTSIEPIGEEES